MKGFRGNPYLGNELSAKGTEGSRGLFICNVESRSLAGLRDDCVLHCRSHEYVFVEKAALARYHIHGEANVARVTVRRILGCPILKYLYPAGESAILKYSCRYSSFILAMTSQKSTSPQIFCTHANNFFIHPVGSSRSPCCGVTNLAAAFSLTTGLSNSFLELWK